MVPAVWEAPRHASSFPSSPSAAAAAAASPATAAAAEAPGVADIRATSAFWLWPAPESPALCRRRVVFLFVGLNLS